MTGRETLAPQIRYALVCCGALSSMASGSQQLRPSEVRYRSCQDTPELTVCAINPAGEGLPQLDIYYKGYLNAPQYGGVVAWVKLGAKSGFFHLSRSKNENLSFLRVGSPVVEYQCVIASRTFNDYPACPDSTPGQPGSLAWYYELASDRDAALLEGGYDANGEPQPWQLEFAFASVDGRYWDSQYGQNYKFGFELPQQ